MMGRQTGDQSQLFYLFNLEERIPANHLLRRINPIVRRGLADLREKLAPFYSDMGRPSIDPELTRVLARRLRRTMPTRCLISRCYFSEATSTRGRRSTGGAVSPMTLNPNGQRGRVGP
jgi:hypothetical protein